MAVVKLRASDSQTFTLEPEVAYLSKTVEGLMEETDPDVPVELSVTGSILVKAIEWMTYHVEASKSDSDGEPSKSEEDVKTWETQFVKIGNLTRAELVDLIKAANYLDIHPLLMTACASLKEDLMQFKDDYEGLQKFYQVKGDLTPEDIEEISKEQKWAFD